MVGLTILLSSISLKIKYTLSSALGQNSKSLKKECSQLKFLLSLFSISLCCYCLTEYAFLKLAWDICYNLLYVTLPCLLELMHCYCYHANLMLCILSVGWSLLPRCNLYSKLGFALKPSGQWTMPLILHKRLFEVKCKPFSKQ